MGRTEMADNVADGLAGLSIDPEAKLSGLKKKHEKKEKEKNAGPSKKIGELKPPPSSRTGSPCLTGSRRSKMRRLPPRFRNRSLSLFLTGRRWQVRPGVPRLMKLFLGSAKVLRTTV